MQRLVLIVSLILVTASAVSAQVVGQGSPATTSDANAWPVKIVFGGAQIDPRAVTVSGTVTVDSELAAAAALSDNFPNPTTAPIGAFAMVWDGATWDRWTGAVTVTSFPDNEPINVAQFGGSAVTTGRGPSGSGIPRVTGSQENMTGTVSLTSGAACPAASATAPTTSAGCVVIPLAGYTGAGFGLQTGTLTATLEWDFSDDGGSTWDNTGTAIAIVNGNQDYDGFAVTNPNVGVTGVFIVSSHWTHVRVRLSAFTSGAATLTVSAANLVTPLAVGAVTAGVISQPFVSGIPLFANMTGLRAATTTPSAGTATQPVTAAGDVYGVPYTRLDHPARINCTINSTATTSTLVTGCSAPGASLSIYITALSWYSSIISSTTNFMTIQSGTGGNCGASVDILYRGFAQVAFSGREVVFQTPIKVPANEEVCLLHPGAGTRLVNIQGFIAP